MKVHKQLTLLVFVLLISMVAVLVYPAEPKEGVWKIEIHYGLLDETVCAFYNFDTLDSCEKTRDWFETAAAWHGQNTYQCVLDSQCPKE